MVATTMKERRSGSGAVDRRLSTPASSTSTRTQDTQDISNEETMTAEKDESCHPLDSWINSDPNSNPQKRQRTESLEAPGLILRPQKKARCHSEIDIYTSSNETHRPRDPGPPKTTHSIQKDLSDVIMEDEKDEQEYDTLLGSIPSEDSVTPSLWSQSIQLVGSDDPLSDDSRQRTSFNRMKQIETRQNYRSHSLKEVRRRQTVEVTEATSTVEQNEVKKLGKGLVSPNMGDLAEATTASAPKMKKPLPGADSPYAMSCELMPHQRIGLQWLLNRELGADRGGVLADDMGLGKTIQALALILANPPKNPHRKTTLIVAPLALLKQWPQEMDEKIKPGHKLTVHVFHGQGKKIGVDEVKSYDVVLTNYETLAVEQKQRENKEPGAVLTSDEMVFHRVILDEALLIKNWRTLTARGALELKATYRLAMSGTPLMNRPEELYSLMAFLRISPYDIYGVFMTAICTMTYDVKTRRYVFGISATKKVKELRDRTMLIRSKKDLVNERPIVSLPSCRVVIVEAEFGDAEARVYKKHFDIAHDLVQNSKRNSSGPLGGFRNLFSQLLRLRQICLHPNLLPKPNDDHHGTEYLDFRGLSSQDPGVFEESKKFEDTIDGDTAACREIMERQELFFPPRKGRQTKGRKQAREHFRQLEVEYQPSTKINTILRLLFSIRDGNPSDKTIIFTFFTSFMDILEVALRQESVFKWQRFDGTMTPAEEDRVVADFMNAESDTTVLLTSLKAGNAGLNLNTATNVIIVEPYWNPYVEQQAIDRAHRIGQKREVTVYKLIIPYTVEEGILKLQDTKRDLVNWALGTGDTGQRGQERKNKSGLTKKDNLRLLDGQR